MSFIKSLLVSVAVLAAPVAAHAAAINITQQSTLRGVPGTGFVVGYSFRAAQDINVTALGNYDANGDLPTLNADVGLYDEAGTLLARATVTNSDTREGFFRFASIAPVLLQADTLYVLGSYSNDPLAFVNANYGGLRYDVDPLITLNRNRDLPRQTGLAFPSREPSNNHAGSFGPNFQFEIAQADVPEPAALALLGLGVLGIAAARRRG